MGIYKPKTPEFDVPLVLDLIEAAYLLEKGRIEVIDQAGRPVSLEDLFKYAKRTYTLFEEKYRVYKDLRDAGYVVISGLKFGSAFAVYKKGPGLEHAPYIVDVMDRNEEIGSTEIIRAGRLATSVRKRFIIAVPLAETGEVRYLLFKWWKA